MLRTTILATCLLVSFLPATSAAEERSLPDWLDAFLAERGIDSAGGDLRLVRTQIGDGSSTTFEVPLSALPVDDPFGGRDVAPPGIPSVLVGQLTQHVMIQVGSCGGYGATSVAEGISLIEDGSWDLGVHLALVPAAGGVAASTGGDPVANLLVIAGTDTGLSPGVGDLAIQEDRIEIFGQCLALLGTMSGTGAWQFT